MSHWTNGDDQSGPGASAEGQAPTRRSRILYFWPPPVGTERSAEVGRRMLIGTIAWVAVLIVVAILLALLLAVAG